MKKVYLQSILMGVIAGMRSLSAPAFVSNHLVDKQSLSIENSNFRPLASPNVRNGLTALAVGEMAADKLPIVPDRISPLPLLGRAAAGAICGASLCTAENERSGIGAITGALAASASAYCFYYLRKRIAEGTRIPDPLIGLAEDIIVIKGGQSILR
jgi:uncharacterized membrane protein